MGDKILDKLFIRYNTAVPSSAAVERFFSQGKDILKAKGGSLSDETLEMLMYMGCAPDYIIQSVTAILGKP